MCHFAATDQLKNGTFLLVFGRGKFLLEANLDFGDASQSCGYAQEMRFGAATQLATRDRSGASPTCLLERNSS